jgi:uncharacterized membrane protein YidH (DUF202 family)
MKKTIFALGYALLLAPLTAFGAVDSPEKVVGVIEKASVWLYNILIAGSVVMIIIAAFNFLGSGGSEEKVTKAKNQVIYAVIAVAVAILATSVQKLIQDFLQ